MTLDNPYNKTTDATLRETFLYQEKRLLGINFPAA